jgi:hypothetical protein
MSEISIGEENYNYFTNGRYKANNSPKAKSIKKKLEDNGHTNVFVWYEKLGKAMEMCGCSGGYMYTSDQSPIEPIGYSFDEAMITIEKKWHKISK